MRPRGAGAALGLIPVPRWPLSAALLLACGTAWAKPMVDNNGTPQQPADALLRKALDPDPLRRIRTPRAFAEELAAAARSERTTPPAPARA